MEENKKVEETKKVKKSVNIQVPTAKVAVKGK